MIGMFIVVSYDIVDDRRRTKVFKTLEGFGAHVQYSVFECDLRPEDFERLQKRLKRLIKPKEDQIRYYPLCKSCVERALVDGVGSITRVEPFKIV